jgi:hypothetical protein
MFRKKNVILQGKFVSDVQIGYNRVKMERYKAKTEYQIVDISRSNDSLSIKRDNVLDDVKLFFQPYLVLDSNNLIATTILTSQFVGKDESPFTNELTVRVVYKYLENLPLSPNGADKVKINNYENLVSMFDTSIGIFRGILFEWLKGSSLQHPLPAVDIERFLKGLRISFSK